MTQRLVLFDIDGTLVMSKGIGREAKRRAMTEFFGMTGDIDNHVFGGKTDWRILADLLEPEGKTVDEIGAVIDAYHEVMARHMQDLVEHYETETLPYTMDLVNTLRDREDTIIGVVTGNMEKAAIMKLEMGGFDPAWFQVGAYGNESPNRDDLTRLALQRARDLADIPFTGDKVVVIGDTDADITAARAIGATSVAVCTGHVHRDKLICCDPDFLLADLSTFVDLVMV
jgi:phosphoglycolate phosphatase-like HAD superfamily hydrolase